MSPRTADGEPTTSDVGDARVLDAAESDRPEAYLPGDRRRAIAAGRELPERVHGAGLFADISGFTPLTEALGVELGPQRGAEELTDQLNRVFHAVIDDVDRFGGEVIYFSGDAITCWLDGDDGRRAAACAQAIQRTIGEVGLVVTPNGSEFTLAIKVAVAVGSARRFVVGDPTIQLIDVLAGRLVDELADAEHFAVPGDVILAASALASLGDRITVSELRADDARANGDGRSVAAVGVLATIDVPVDPWSAPVGDVLLTDEQVRPWLLPAVYERLTSSRGEFVAELRPAYPMFVHFGGIDHDDDPDAVTKLDGFVRTAQAVLSSYGGNLLQMTIGDKGAYLYGVFGTPHAHEDDATRACAAALELLTLERETAVTDLQIGIAYGRLRSGTYGHRRRRTFVCLGDAVNLSARLMSRAPVGAAYLSDEVRRAAGDRVECEVVGDLTVKGKVEPIRVHSIVGMRHGAVRRETRYPLPMVGRDAEMGVLNTAFERATRGEGQVVAIAAEAGRGKSRLIAEVVRELRADGHLVAFGEAQSLGRSTSYLVWREVWQTLLEIDAEAPEASQWRQVTRSLSSIDEILAQRAPLLAPLLGLDMADTELTARFDAKLRKASLESLLVDVLRDRAAETPLVVVLEDCHSIDPLSRDLLEELVRSATALPVMFLLGYRPEGEPGGGLGLEGLPQFTELVLDELGAVHAHAVVRAKLDHLFGADAVVAPRLIELVATRAQGNPFYIEELLNFVHALGIDPSDDAAVARLHVPDSLHRLVLGRIDLLAEGPRSTLKVASVVGRSFEVPFVHGVYPELGSGDEIAALVAVSGRAELVSLDRAEEQAWIFRHVVTRDVAYDSLPFSMRAQLHHRAGSWVEAMGAEAIERNLDLLAHHFSHSDDHDRTRDYLVRAGIAAQGRYANDAAVDYYRRAIPLVSVAERPALMRRLGKVLELTGGWREAERTYADAFALCAELGDEPGAARARTDLAEALRKQGRFDAARRELDLAQVTFEEHADDAGLGLVLHLCGTLASQQGRYDEARERYQASLAIRERLGERSSVGGLLSNLALVAEMVGDLELARAMNERALAVRIEVGDRWAISVSQNNVGMMALAQREFDAARQRFEESMRLAGEVGDRWVVAVGHHNLGNAHLGLGRFEQAAEEFILAMEAYRAHDDEWSLTQLLEDVVPLAIARDEWEIAAELFGAADTLRERLDAPRPPVTTEMLDAAIAPHRAWWNSDGIAPVQRGRNQGITQLGKNLHKLAIPSLSVTTRQ